MDTTIMILKCWELKLLHNLRIAESLRTLADMIDIIAIMECFNCLTLLYMIVFLQKLIMQNYTTRRIKDDM
ncbi:hypothetical protein D1872_228880 [compost metagenome]